MTVFPLQKLVFGRFWNCKKWNWVKKIIREIDLFDFASFLVWTFFNYLEHHCGGILWRKLSIGICRSHVFDTTIYDYVETWNWPPPMCINLFCLKKIDPMQYCCLKNAFPADDNLLPFQASSCAMKVGQKILKSSDQKN